MKPQFWRLWPLQQVRQSPNPALRVLCSALAWGHFWKTNQPTNQPDRKISQKNLQRFSNTSEIILWLIGEVLTAAIKFGVVALYFLLFHHTSGSFEVTVAGVNVVKRFKWLNQIFTSKDLWQNWQFSSELLEVSFWWGLVWFFCGFPSAP